MPQVSLGKGSAARGPLPFTYQSLVLAGDLVLTRDSPTISMIDPGGVARNIDLPAEEESGGLIFIIHNTSVPLVAMTVRDDAANTIISIQVGEGSILYCDGAQWRGFVGANT